MGRSGRAMPRTKRRSENMRKLNLNAYKFFLFRRAICIRIRDTQIHWRRTIIYLRLLRCGAGENECEKRERRETI